MLADDLLVEQYDRWWLSLTGRSEMNLCVMNVKLY